MRTLDTMRKRFLSNFPKILRIAAFQKTLGDSFHQKLLLCLYFPCSISFKKHVYVINFGHVFRYSLMKYYLIILNCTSMAHMCIQKKKKFTAEKNVRAKVNQFTT